MTWLIGQLWLLMLIAFAVGALVAWLVVAIVLPHESKLEAETGTDAKGVLG